MTGLIVLLFIPALAAVFLAFQVRRQRRELDALRQSTRRDADATSPHASASSSTTPPQGDPMSATSAAAHHDDAMLDGRSARLLGIVAHELRSPIAAILGYVELLEEGVFGPVDDNARESYTRIRSSAQQLLTLTDGMHGFARDDAVDDDAGVLDVGECMRAARTRFATEAEARRVDLAPLSAPQPAPVRAEPESLSAVCDALMGAALKSSAGRTIHVSVKVDDGACHVAVAGTGLESDSVMADPFASGSAFRIAVARRLAGRLGGSLDVRNHDDAATIHVSLPLARPDSD